jgi:hypothetical protein
MQDSSEAVTEMLYDGFEKAEKEPINKMNYRPEDQPKYFSWVTIDVQFKTFCIDASSAIAYRNTNDMKSELENIVTKVMSTDLLHRVRTGQIVNLTLRIGPTALSGMDHNNELEIENFKYAETKDK